MRTMQPDGIDHRMRTYGLEATVYSDTAAGLAAHLRQIADEVEAGSGSRRPDNGEVHFFVTTYRDVTEDL